MKLVSIFLAALPLAAGPATVIQNATVITVTKGTFRGAVVVRDGKIVAAGEKAAVPADAKVIDAGGQYVMPGIIDAHSHIAADSINEGSIAVASMVDIHDVINAESIAIYRALAGGVTTACILHGSADPIGGQNALLKMRWGKDARGLLFEGAPPTLKLATGENVKRPGQQQQIPGMPSVTPRYPATRMGVEDVLRQSFTEARAYQRQWSEYRARAARGEQAVPPRRDLKLEPLVEVLENRRYVHAHCYRSDEILMLLRVAEEFGFKIRVLVHVLEGYKVAKEIAAHGAGASTFSDWWAYKMEAFDSIPYNAALMHQKGVLVSLNSDDAELMRRLNTEAAKAIKYGGVSENDALAMITINPAKQLGVDGRVGSIEPGKDADLVMYDRHPLSVYAKVQKVMIDGQLYFDRDSDISERSAREKRKKELLEKARAQQKKSGPAERRPR
ncbi:MAG: amidohydrolase [Bryobacteraceae bacterium]